MLFFAPLTANFARTCSRSASTACLSALIIAGLTASSAFAALDKSSESTPLGGGTLSITKRIDGIPAGSALDDALFWVSIVCSSTPKGSSTVVGLTVNMPTQLLSIEPSTTCTLTELSDPPDDPGYVFPAAPAGYAWQPAIAPPVDVETDATGNAAAVIINTLRATGSAQTTALPALSNTILLLLAAVLGAFGMRQMRRRAQR